MEIERKHLCFKHPCRILVAGPSGSGKTQLIRKLLADKSLFYNLEKPRINVLWVYGIDHPLLDVKISADINLKLTKKFPSDEELRSFKTDILVIDDKMTDMGKLEGLESMFTQKGHHMNITIFMLVQNPYYSAHNRRTVSLQCNYLIFMKNRRDVTQINHAAKESGIRYLPEVYRDATISPYGYIRIDDTQDTPEELRLVTNLETYPIIYKLKEI